MISFFSRLFKKAPSEATGHTHTSAEKKSNSRSSTPTTSLPTVPQHYTAELITIALSDPSAKRKTTARQRIAKLLEEKTITLEQITSDAANTDDLLTLCSFNETAAAQILSTVQDQNILATLANDAPTAAVRKAAAEKVTQRSAIERMLKGAKGKDKQVYKIAKTALAVFKAEDEALEQKHAYLASLCGDAERHGKQTYNHLYTHKFMSLEKEWEEAKSNATPQLQTRFDNAIAKCQAIIDAQIAQERAKAQAEETANATVTGIIAASKNIETLAVEIYNATQWTPENQTQTEQQLKAQTEAVRALIDQAQVQRQENTSGALPTPEETEQASKKRQNQQKAQQAAQQYFYQVSEATHGLLNKIQQSALLHDLTLKLTQPTSSQEPQTQELMCSQIAELLAFSSHFKNFNSPAVQSAQAAIADWQKEQKSQALKRKNAISHLSDLMRRASGAARNGQMRRARGIYRELNEKRAQLNDLPQGLSNKLEDLDAEMAKLGDWHEFAVTPKKEALVATMDSLHSSPLAPDDLADKIHSLQEQWKLLCKGGENQDAELWQAFQASADIAFEPCKKHFAEQAQMREANAKARLELIDQLNAYHDAYDWDKAIWKDVEHTLRVAKDTWKTLWPVPRHQQKEIQAPFDAVLDKIYAHMNNAYDEAKAQKEQLIMQAKTAAQNSDIKAAAEHVKQLQANWKKIGRSYRKTDQQLWAEFRTVCDEIFNKRQAIYDEANAERDQLIAQAQTHIDQLVAISQKPGSELQTLSGEIAEIKAAFYALGELPKTQVSQLEQQLQTIQKNIEQYRSTAKQQAWHTLFDLNKQLNGLEIEAQKGHDISEQIDAFKTALTEQKLPSTNANLLSQRINAITINNSDANVNNEAIKQLQRLCIRAEIAKGIESPASDKQLRMEYQVEALQQNFGATQNDTPESLTEQWLAVNRCPSTEFNTLQTRFLNCCFPELTQ